MQRQQLEVEGRLEITIAMDKQKYVELWECITQFIKASMHYSYFDLEEVDGEHFRVLMSVEAHTKAAKHLDLPEAKGPRRNPVRAVRAVSPQANVPLALPRSKPKMDRRASTGSRSSIGSRASTGSARCSSSGALAAPAAPPPMNGVVVMPLCLDAEQQTTIVETIPAFGGTVSSDVCLATHFLVADEPSDWKELERQMALLPKSARVVKLAWLQAVLTQEGDPFDEGLTLTHRASPPISGLLPYSPPAKRHKPNEAHAPEQGGCFGGSLQETWAFLRANRPEDAEAGELRVAIARSLLDCALQLHTGRADAASVANGALGAPVPEDLPPEEVLGVKAGATANELRAAYREKMLAAHPDKGGDAAAFCRVKRAYLSLTRGEKGGEGPTRALQSDPDRCPDFDMKSHRDLVRAKFEEDGVDLSACLRKQASALQELGLRTRDLGASNKNEKGEAMYNQCFYLSLAHSFLQWDAKRPTGVGASNNPEIKEMALTLKRVIECAVLEAHPDWGGTRVGEDVQAFSDFLFFALSQPGLLSEVGVAIFDACSGGVELYRGRDFPGDERVDEQRANLLTLQYVPGHYKALAPTGRRPTPAELERVLEYHGVTYVMTDV